MWKEIPMEFFCFMKYDRYVSAHKAEILNSFLQDDAWARYPPPIAECTCGMASF